MAHPKETTSRNTNQASKANANNTSSGSRSLPAVTTTEMIPTATEIDQSFFTGSSRQSTQFFTGAPKPPPAGSLNEGSITQLKPFSKSQDINPLQKKCGCASCCGSSVDTNETIQRYEESDEEWSEGSEDEGCVDTVYHDDDCELKIPYYNNVRRYFYPSNYHQATLNWKTNRMNALQDPNNANNFMCPGHCNNSIPKANGTIEHILSVVQHWNAQGHNETQADRIAWYNDTSNHEVMCGPCNSGLGGGANYQTNVGPDFDGP